VNLYVPILAIAAIGFGFAIFSVLAAALTGPKRYNLRPAADISQSSIF
jgi:NADH-quinone oxidoreductase subunit A